MAFTSESVQFVVMCILSPHDTQLYTASLLFMGFEHVLHLLLFSILELIYLGLFEWVFLGICFVA